MKHIAILSLFILISLLLGCSRKQGNVSLVKVEVQRVELTEAAQDDDFNWRDTRAGGV